MRDHGTSSGDRGDDATYILLAVAVELHQEVGQVADVVDAAAQLALLAKVVDADQQGLALASTLRVLEGVAGGGAMAELLHALGWHMALVGFRALEKEWMGCQLISASCFQLWVLG